MKPRGRPRSFDRDEALRRAMELFWVKGFENTSMADLTSAMGLNPPSVYAAFGSKEQLFREALDLYVRTEGSGIWDAIEAAPTAREAIARLLRATAVAYTRGPQPRGCMIVLAAPQMEGANPAICDDLREHRLENVAIIERRLERAVAEGELPAGIDCAGIAAYFACVQHGMSIQARDGASRDTLLAIAACAMAGWERLVPNPGQPPPGPSERPPGAR
ncbi:MAG TPA: TetR/AcrR family transcriptional regulator [Alphaproteobacteria bacterium]|nr:TetR/AcrR family transcriptional regulator [Alphaproteobacteria bacterium]